MVVSGKKAFDTAEYLLLQTYPALQDNKLLITILENLVVATDEAISSVLEKAREQKEIPPYNKDNLTVKIETFRRKFAEKYGLQKKDTAVLFEMDHIRRLHKDSAFEFQRKGKFIITDDAMQPQELTQKSVRGYYELVKKLMQRIDHGI